MHAVAAVNIVVAQIKKATVTEPFNDDARFVPLAMVKFLDDMEREKPISFTSHQLKQATANFSTVLGSGGFGTVYKGSFSDGVTAAVKVLNGTSDKRIEEQFMAEVSTMGRTHHFNLVRLYGFCFDSTLRALVYEFMVNGSLDHHLFKVDRRDSIGFEKLQDIALGTARGITYLHEECPQRIVDGVPWGLGYAAPELWMPLPVTHKCDVYSFGMLLFEIIGRRRNMDTTLSDSLQWFPLWAWDLYEKKELNELMTVCGIEKNDQEVVERMLKVALCCVQYRPETRPVMSIVVKMLEGALEGVTLQRMHPRWFNSSVSLFSTEYFILCALQWVS
nr:G-type lectin S-receptor-like serine/threonine-protein kinase At1g34300 [Tanacetum cinerariifolium]